MFWKLSRSIFLYSEKYWQCKSKKWWWERDLVSELQLHTGFYCFMKTMMDVTGFPMLGVGGGGTIEWVVLPPVGFYPPPSHQSWCPPHGAPSYLKVSPLPRYCSSKKKIETVIITCVSLIKQHWKKMAEIQQKCDFLTWSI